MAVVADDPGAIPDPALVVELVELVELHPANCNRADATAMVKICCFMIVLLLEMKKIQLMHIIHKLDLKVNQIVLFGFFC
jgi:hypothetical protein